MIFILKNTRIEELNAFRTSCLVKGFIRVRNIFLVALRDRKTFSVPPVQLLYCNFRIFTKPQPLRYFL